MGVHPDPERALALLRRRGFRRTYLAIAVSELGDAFQYVALMWFALEAGGPLGVIAVRLADSVAVVEPRIVFAAAAVAIPASALFGLTLATRRAVAARAAA